MAKKKGKNSNYGAKAAVNTNKKGFSDNKKKTLIISCISLAVIIVGIIIGIVIVNSREKMGTGASPYLETRDISNSDITYVEMCIEDYGKMVILLDATTAPKTVANFVSLVEDGFYNGITLYSVVKDFMIQGGDPNGDGTGGSENTVKGEFEENLYLNENRIYLDYGVIAMSRDKDYDSATSRFFICNTKDKSRLEHLEGYYAAFGYVVEGMSVVEKITEDFAQYADPANKNIITEKSNQPVIKYIKVLNSWKKP